MARPIRVEFENACYHVMARGNERKPIFFSDNDRHLFLKTLAEAIEKFDLSLHIYCLMPNHYHLAVRTPQANLSKAMGWLQTTFTIRMNRRHKRIGHLFQGRYKAHLVGENEYAQQLVRYIHLNPVRPKDKTAILAKEKRGYFSKYSWSSHHFYAGTRRAPSWLNMEWLSYWSDQKKKAHQKYREEMDHFFGKKTESPWDGLKSGLVLGSDSLLNKVQSFISQKEGADEIRWTQGQTKNNRIMVLQRYLKKEQDDRLKIWLRVVLGGERSIDVAKSYGYKDGSTITHLLARLDQVQRKDKFIRQKIEQWKESISSFKS